MKDRVSEKVENAIVEIATEYPTFGQVQIALKLAKRGITISPTVTLYSPSYKINCGGPRRIAPMSTQFFLVPKTAI